MEFTAVDLLLSKLEKATQRQRMVSTMSVFPLELVKIIHPHVYILLHLFTRQISQIYLEINETKRATKIKLKKQNKKTNAYKFMYNQFYPRYTQYN